MRDVRGTGGLKANWRLGPEQERCSGGASQKFELARRVGDVSRHHEGVSPVPCRALQPIHSAEHRRCASVAGVQAVRALHVVAVPLE